MAALRASAAGYAAAPLLILALVHFVSPRSLLIPALTAVVVLGLAWLLFWPAKKVGEIHAVCSSAFSAEVIPTRIDTIVVGSGIGGCSCANLLAQSGQRVLLLEQHYRTGGCTHSFREEGCEWDTGLHYTSRGMGTKTVRPGALINFMTMGLQKWTTLPDPYDEVSFPEDATVEASSPNTTSSVKYVAGVDRLLNNIIDPSNDELRLRAKVFLDLCMQINTGFTALGISRILPQWLHFLVAKRKERLYHFASMTVRDVQFAILNVGLTPDELLTEGCPKAPNGPEPDPCLRRLKAALTHPIGDYAVQPREASMAAHGVTMAHYSGGSAYPVGSTQGISVRMTSVVRAFGGEVFTDATVQGIIIENGRAVGVRVCSTAALAARASSAGGEVEVEIAEIRAKNVVWASGIYNLYGKMLPPSLQVVMDFHDPSKRTVHPSNGHVYLFCKIRGDATELGLPTHNRWFFNGYDIDEAFDEFFANPTEVRPPTTYIGFPCTKDATWKSRFPGVSNCVIIADARYDWFKEWENAPVHDRGHAYEHLKRQLSKHLLDILYEVVPAVKGKIEHHMLGTPLSEVTYLASFQGGSYGTKCVPEMFSAVNRNWTTNPRTAVPGLFLAGSDAFLPSVCGAMYGGCFGAMAVLGHARTLRLACAFLADFAASIREENPDVSWPRSYCMAAQRVCE